MKRPISFLMPALVSLVLAACSSGGSSSQGPESGPDDAPKIADLVYAPHDAQVGTKTTVSGTFAFEDVNADIAEVGIEVLVPGLTTPITFPRLSARAATNHLASGELQLLVDFVAPTAGNYQFSVYAVDSKGHESNRLVGEVLAR